MYFCKQKTKSLNETAHHILKDDVDLILPQLSTDRKEKRGIITLLISGFTGLVYEGITSFFTL